MEVLCKFSDFDEESKAKLKTCNTSKRTQGKGEAEGVSSVAV